MSFTYGLASGVGAPGGSDRDFVRLTITDTDPALYIFEDQELDAWLTRDPNPLLAAASALETIARSEALVQKRIRILDLTTDGPAVAKSLMDSAKALREQAISGADEEPAFAIAEHIYNEFGYREYLRNLP